jgi:hypothetical protein
LSIRVAYDNILKFGSRKRAHIGSHACLCARLARSGYIIFAALIKNRLSDICFADHINDSEELQSVLDLQFDYISYMLLKYVLVK